LKLLLDQGREVTIIDVRDELSARANPILLPTARWISSAALTERMNELPPNQPIVTYCDCPKDESAIAAVELLHQHGKPQARVLLGGLDGWLAKELPTVEFAPAQS
jgi:rhodanese-related sulfurtransferase